MSFFKNLWADLVEKRLWPVALALVLALVAVPVLLGGGGEEPVGAPLGATGAAGAALSAQVALDTTTAERRDRGGKLRDPFRQPPAPVVETGTTGAAGTAGTSNAPADPGVGGGTGGTPPGSGGFDDPAPTSPPPGPPTTPEAPKPEPPDRYVVALRVFEAGAKTPRVRDVARLTPLPSADRPEFVHLGVLADRRTAVFLLPADVKATGEGTCRPRRSSCETLELRRGDSALLEVAGGDEKKTRYRLELVRVTRVAGAGTAPKTVTVDKPTTVKKAPVEDELGSERYRFDDDAGLLRRIRSSAGLGAHLPAAAGAPASFRAWVPVEDEQDALPVFSPGL